MRNRIGCVQNLSYYTSNSRKNWENGWINATNNRCPPPHRTATAGVARGRVGDWAFVIRSFMHSFHPAARSLRPPARTLNIPAVSVMTAALALISLVEYSVLAPETSSHGAESGGRRYLCSSAPVNGAQEGSWLKSRAQVM
jgi:hypothetical protein